MRVALRRTRRVLFGGAVFLVVVIVLSACAPTKNKSAAKKLPSSSEITGFGATVKAWNATHVEDHRGNVEPGCCFDPTPVPGLVYGDRYYAALPIGGLMISYEMHLPPRTTVRRARTIAMRELPRDARVQSFTVHGKSCAILIASSSKLRATLERDPGVKGIEQAADRFLGTPESASTVRANLGKVVVEFSSGPSGMTYDPTAVNDLLLTSGAIAGPTAQNC